jgi:hypothetical protein
MPACKNENLMKRDGSESFEIHKRDGSVSFEIYK